MAVGQLLQHVVRLFRDHIYITFTVLSCIYFLRNRYQKRLVRVPGPWLRSISTVPRMWSVYKGKSHEDDLRLHRRWGPVVRIAPSIISICDPGAIDQLYGIKTEFIKSNFYELAETYDENGAVIPDPFVLRDKNLHARMKRNAGNAYSLNGIIQMESLLGTPTSILLRLLDRHADHSSPCDLGETLKNYAMDAVTSITFGTNFDYLNKGDHMRLFPVLEFFTSYMAIFGQISWCHKFLLKNTRLASWLTGGASSQAELIALCQQKMKSGKGLIICDSQPATFMERLLANQKLNPSLLTDSEIVTHVLGNLSAGSDTTVTALRAFMYQVLTHRVVYEKLVVEVREKLHSPVQFSDAEKLPYLNACIKETLRIHPPVGMILARTLPRTGTMICGHYMGARTEVGINPWLIHRLEPLFSAPEHFRPERWLDDNDGEDHLRQMNRAFIPFGHGHHTCSGRYISLMEMTKVLATLLLNYDMELHEHADGYRFVNHWFTTQKGLWVKLRRRLS